jgi:2-polyprenyl-6-methoxyphenol hydroxylase-like FAD-dependent oxidoreductase
MKRGNAEDVLSTAVDHDALVVGASLSGCATAMLLARAGARVALVDKRHDIAAFKRVCGHYIQSSAIATIERLGLMEAMTDAGAVRSRMRIRVDRRWIDPGALSTVAPGINLRRELLDPLIRRAAAETPGVELILGRSAHELLRSGDRICGVVLRDQRGVETRLRARLVIGADGGTSPVAALAGARSRISANGRFNYGAYFEGPPPAGAPDGSIWLMGSEWAGALPTDAGLTVYTCMLAKDRLPEFRRDPAAALVAFISALSEAPPIRDSRLIGSVIGKLEMPIIARRPTAPGLALVGDAALIVDPLWAVGCGWALQSAEWLADSVAGPLLGEGSLARGLTRYRRRHARRMRGHVFMMRRYAAAHPTNFRERFLLSAATRDERLAASFEEYATRSIGPGRLVSKALPRAVSVAAHHALSR